MKQFWLVKTEPGSFSIDDLISAPNQITSWDGVRNYQARNFMRDDMKKGDPVFFYHSVTKPAIVGLAKVVRESYPDHTAWDETDSHFDPRSLPEKPLWFMVDIQFVEKFKEPLPLAMLRTIPELEGMVLLKKGSRLSVMPVSREHFSRILKLAGSDFSV